MANCVRSCWFDRACRNTRHRMVASSPLRNRSSVITLKRRQADPARNVRDNLHMLLFGTLPRRCAMPCRPRRHIAQSDRGSMTSRFDEWLPIENMHLPTLVTRREAMKRKWRHLRRWPPLIPGGQIRLHHLRTVLSSKNTVLQYLRPLGVGDDFTIEASAQTESGASRASPVLPTASCLRTAC